ncbi:unnamed protein product [Prorocentrum cordatum]|uniref:Uncharacterized protein n=1 Tax=Prorocentrum cordatum TaxID=2364126 RepID=A0ABN9TQC1_9DINO|nr:unnamed protein product [Polarella glacialis]|mmetsp:Transcript_60791/g.172870  ORF Transcript_60791/g.172870 Transcript_60791/m.172870 type:complete len:541 (+) Transcript_60791:43-1665(+)
MGCVVLKAIPVAPLNPDKRYDTLGFNAWANQHIGSCYAIAWLKVGFLRHLCQRNLSLPLRHELDRTPGSCHWGAPPDECQLYYASYAYQNTRSVLWDLVAILEQECADDGDLVFMLTSSIFLKTSTGQDVFREAPEDCSEVQLSQAVNRTFAPMLCYWKIRTVLLPRLYDAAAVDHGVRPFFERKWCTVDVILAAYCQRIVSLQSDSEAQKLIQTGTDPARFENIKELFTQLGGTTTAAWDVLVTSLKELVPIPRDAVGFAHFCSQSQIAWLMVSYVRELARRGGPVPRRQEMRLGGYLVGAPPRGVRKFVVSHGWETEVHPNPSGSKMRRLVEKLGQLGANDSDVVFFDFCSNPQDNKMGRTYAKNEPAEGLPARDASAQPYFQQNNVSYYPARTRSENQQFKFAMWEMGRLYSFHECEVLVLPTLDTTLPGGDVWGIVNSAPYKIRGWCCAEFSIALYCGTIRNLDDPDVEHVRASRTWPADNSGYAEMMSFTTKRELQGAGLKWDPDRGVDFTVSGDRHAVRYNFFKMALQGPSLGS